MDRWERYSGGSVGEVGMEWPLSGGSVRRLVVRMPWRDESVFDALETLERQPCPALLARLLDFGLGTPVHSNRNRRHRYVPAELNHKSLTTGSVVVDCISPSLSA